MHGVQLRVQNKTATDFSQVSTNGVVYDHVMAGSISEYVTVEKMVGAASATLITGNDTLSCGLFYTDGPVDYIEEGKYTLQIFTDTAAYYGYNCVYIKE